MRIDHVRILAIEARFVYNGEDSYVTINEVLGQECALGPSGIKKRGSSQSKGHGNKVSAHLEGGKFMEYLVPTLFAMKGLTKRVC